MPESNIVALRASIPSRSGTPVFLAQLFRFEKSKQLFEELEKYFEFIQNILNNSGDHLQPLYSITGEKDLYEMELDYLSGYLGNKPVRIGNKAYEQVQYDVYGQVLVGVMPLYTDRRLTFTRKSSYKKIVSWLLGMPRNARLLAVVLFQMISAWNPFSPKI